MSSWKRHYPIFDKYPDLVYLDSSATALKPRKMIDALVEYYSFYSANVFRGECEIAQRATHELESARFQVAKLLGVIPQEIVFVSGATQGLNLVSFWLSPFVEKEDRIVTTVFEHHSNYLPWQRIARERRADFEVWPVDQKDFSPLLPENLENIKIFAFSLVSNVLGQRFDASALVQKIKSKSDAFVVIDASQAVGHFKLNPLDLGADFLVFSGHKLGGPTGVGVVWARKEFLEEFYPAFLGGGQVKEVNKEKVEFLPLPFRHEAGTPHIAGIIGLGACCKFLREDLGLENIEKKEKELIEYFFQKADSFEGLEIVGPRLPENKTALFSFNLKSKEGLSIHPHDVASELSRFNICVRAGHHCAIPLHKDLGLSSTVRASCFAYTDKEDIDKLFWGLQRIRELF